ncbi:hypothetical protein [Methanopyrus kandleri]
MTARKIDSWFPIATVSEECGRERDLGSPVEVLPGFRSPVALARAVVLLSLTSEDTEEDALLPSLRPIVGEPWRTLIEVPDGDVPRKVWVLGDGSIALEAARMGREVRLAVSDPAVARFLREVFGRLFALREEALEELEEFLHEVGEVLRDRFGDFYGREDRAYLWIKRVRCPGCGLLVPLMEHRWVVEGRYALELDVPEDGDEVEFEVVEAEEAGPGTVRDGRVVCPGCGRSRSVEGVRRDLSLRAARREGEEPVDAYLAVVVREDGSVRPATDRDLERFELAREEFRREEWEVPRGEPPEGLKRWGIWDVSWLFNRRQLLAHVEAAVATSEVDGDRYGIWAAAVLTELSLRNSVLSRWDPVTVEPRMVVGWAWDHGELPVPSAWREVSDEITEACRELVEVAEDVEVEVVKADEANRSWSIPRDLPDVLFRAWSELVSNVSVGEWKVPVSGGGWARTRAPLPVVGGLGWDDRVSLILRGDRIAGRWEEIVGWIVGCGLEAASAWPVIGEDALVVPLVGREPGPEEVDWEGVVEEVRGSVRELMREVRDLRGRGWRSVRLIPYAAALPPCTGVDVARRDGDSLGVRHPEVLSEVLAVGWRELVEAVLELLDVGLSDPRARFYAVYRSLWGYPGPEDAPGREVEPPLRALGLNPNDLPYLDADGRLKTYRERWKSRLRPEEDPVDAFHAALLKVVEDGPGSALEALPEEVRGEVLGLALAVARAARRRGEDHPEAELARRLVGVSAGAAAR